MLALLASIAMRAQGSYFHQLKAEEMSQGTNAYTYHDSRGFVWISSIDGLNRFDGQKVRVYRPKADQPRTMLGQNVITPFFEDKNGDLWFCTYEAVNCYRRRTDDFEHWQLHDPDTKQLLKEDYFAFHFDRDRVLWLRIGDNDKGRLYKFYTQDGKYEKIGPLYGNRCFPDTAADGKFETGLLI